MQGHVDRLKIHSSGTAPTTIPLEDFSLFQKLIEEKTGIHLLPIKQSLLVNRLSRRLRDLRLDSFHAYYEHVVSGEDPEELVLMLELMTTNETYFFREPNHFVYLKDHVFPHWLSQGRTGQGTRTIRVWSAACSTGEEPYSLGMLLLDYFPPEAGWHIDIWATDFTKRVLEHAVQGVWNEDQATNIPPPYLKKFMLRGTGEFAGKVKVKHKLQSIITFARMNLMWDRYDIPGLFDLIFCRNVLIYFDRDRRVEVVSKLLDHLDPQGLFFLGHSESLMSTHLPVRSVHPTIYAKEA